MSINARHVTEDAHVIVNGRRVPALIKKGEHETISIELESLPPKGLHFLQVQNTTGLFSNDFIFHVADKASDLVEGSRNDPEQVRNRLERVIASGSMLGIKRVLKEGDVINLRHSDNGMTPLASAAYHGKAKVTALLLEEGADVKKTNRDGNTALHLASFMCRTEVANLLLKNGASLTTRNHRRESPIDVVSGDWSKGLSDFYQFISDSAGLGLDLEEIKKARPQMAKRLREHSRN